MTDPATRPSGARRAEDRYSIPLFIAGVLLVAAAIALKIAMNASDTLVITLAVLGAALLPGHKVIELVRIWKREKPAP